MDLLAKIVGALAGSVAATVFVSRRFTPVNFLNNLCCGLLVSIMLAEWVVGFVLDLPETRQDPTRVRALAMMSLVLSFCSWSLLLASARSLRSFSDRPNPLLTLFELWRGVSPKDDDSNRTPK